MNAVIGAVTLVQQNLLFRLYKHYIIDGVVMVRRHGFRELVRRRGVEVPPSDRRVLPDP
jgi:hypothetical protein